MKKSAQNQRTRTPAGARPGRGEVSIDLAADGNAPDAAAPQEELRTEVIHTRLRDAILKGDFDSDVPISQVQLAKRLGVSRTPLREALRMLQREGLIWSEPNRRVRVAALSLADLEELYALRIPLEALAISLSVARFSKEDLVELQRLLDEMDKIAQERDVERWEVPHRLFHELLRRHAGERIGRLARELADHSERYRRVYLAEPRAWSSAASEHVAIADACKAKNASLAAAQLARHLARTPLTIFALMAPEHDPAVVRSALRLVTRSGNRH